MLGGWDGENLLDSVEGLGGGSSQEWSSQSGYVLTQPRYRCLLFHLWDIVCTLFSNHIEHILHIIFKPRHCASGTSHGVVVTGGYPTTRFGRFSKIPAAHGSSIYTSLGSELLSCFSAEAGFLFLR